MGKQHLEVKKMCPLVKIEIRKGKSAEYKKAILDGIHQALVDCI